MREATGIKVYTCGTCDQEFGTRDEREAHLDATGHGVRRHALNRRPQAGAPASNQFGTFTVHYASEKQTKFIGSLLNSKNLQHFDPSTDLDALRTQVANNQVNKKAASSIIDALLALPDAQAMTATPASGNTATDKQKTFIRTLLAERAGNLTAEALRDALNIRRQAGTLTASFASQTIEALLAIDKNSTEIEAGVYTDGTDTFRVYLGQQSGKMLAAKVVEHDGHAEFEYAGQADRFVTAAFRKLTIAEAARFGKATGTCIVCARRLDVPESVDRGIGPVCFAKMGG